MPSKRYRIRPAPFGTYRPCGTGHAYTWARWILRATVGPHTIARAFYSTSDVCRYVHRLRARGFRCVPQ